MQKPLREMAGFLQRMLPPQIPEAFEIDGKFRTIATEEIIRKGVPSFKDFMYQLYSRLIAEGSAFDKPKKEAHEFSDSANITTSYPFISNIAVLLSNMGVHGTLSDNRDALLLDGIEMLTAENIVSNAKISETGKVDCLRFLTDCGIRFEGLDLSGKKAAALAPLVVTYPENPEMLTGLKVMATVQRDVSSKYVNDILLRCDYRVLANRKAEILPLLKDLTAPLPADVQAFILKLHTDYMGLGYKCDTYVGSSTRFEYFCRSKELWRFNLSLNNGHNITIKANNTEKYPDIIKKLPAWLQAKIEKGYGCGKKMGLTDSCDGGCRGYRIPLNESFMDISEAVKAWLEKEVSCIQNK
ncbi:MAG: hypothetical protein FWD90_10760 [Defluviitaleaceae bacterium]|nr:hypothetical protein [Defluviitaleaceae bacterium]